MRRERILLRVRADRLIVKLVESEEAKTRNISVLALSKRGDHPTPGSP
jgi:hypothetical protein